MTGSPRWDPPLEPTPEEARDALREELLRPEYRESDLLQRIRDWLAERFTGPTRTPDAGGFAVAQSIASWVVLIVLVLVLAWLISRARWSRSEHVARRRSLFGEEVVSAADLRRRAERALAEGRYADAVVDGYRALALRQIEVGVIEDVPGATAGEVARALAAELPARGAEVLAVAHLFDEVMYGERPADADRARGVLALDDDLAGVR
ncbi:MAG: DUF4129 domain-containing protein [Nocardioides alkalitolerans]